LKAALGAKSVSIMELKRGVLEVQDRPLLHKPLSPNDKIEEAA